METSEIGVLRKIVRKTLRDKEISENFRKTCQTDIINECVLKRKRDWDHYITTMDNSTIVKIDHP